MPNRYTYRKLFDNRLRMYLDQRKARRVRTIRHYNTPNMTYPKGSQVENLVVRNHVWKQGDRYYKLAQQYYGDTKLWWLIAWYNMAPTDSHLKIGQIVKIPTPLDAALSYMRDLS